MEQLASEHTFGGLPRGLFTGGSLELPAAAAEEEVFLFLFLLPGGRPLPRLAGTAGASGGDGSAGAGRGEHGERELG